MSRTARQDFQGDEGGGDSLARARSGKCEWSFGENPT
jgi:hypothetical protein